MLAKVVMQFVCRNGNDVGQLDAEFLVALTNCRIGR